jgi:phage terminase large subunit-like protein
MPEINKDDPGEVDVEVLRTAIRQANPWKDEDAVEDLVRDFPKMPRHTFCRYHLAKWVKVPKKSWLKDVPGAWEDCAGPAEFRKGDGKVALAWDMSLNRDTTAVGAAQKRSDGKVVVRVKVFSPDDFEGGRIDNGTVKQYVRDLYKELDAAGCAYDPRFLENLSQELEDESYTMINWPQSPERMSPACAQLFDLIVAGELEHPNDPELNEHVYNAVKRPTDRGWTLSKRLSAGPIDGCIVLVMATAEALTEDDSESVYEERGLVTL